MQNIAKSHTKKRLPTVQKQLNVVKMSEYLISIKIEKLEEGGYLATSDTLQGLIAQGRSIAETMEIYSAPS